MANNTVFFYEQDLTVAAPSNDATLQAPISGNIAVSVSDLDNGKIIVQRMCTQETTPAWRNCCQYTVDVEANVEHGGGTSWVYRAILSGATSGTVHVVMTSK